MRRRVPLLFVLALAQVGCVEPFSGSHIQLVMGQAVLPPCQVIARYSLTGLKSCSTKTGEEAELENRLTHHYELWATLRESGVVYLGSFTVQRMLFKDEQFALEKAGVLRSNGTPFRIGLERTFAELDAGEQKEALERMVLMSKKLAVTSFSPTKLEPDGKTLSPDLYLGFYGQITLPLNGTFLGEVLGTHPFGTLPTGGGELLVDVDLEGLDSLWVTIDDRDPERASPKPSAHVYLQGRAQSVNRGVINVDAASPLDPGVVATFAVSTSLDDEEYF